MLSGIYRDPEKVRAYTLRATQKAAEAMRKRRSCLFPGCHKRAISSHAVQKAKLRHLSDGAGTVVAFDDQPMRYMADYYAPTVALDVVKIGLDKATVFWGFCSKHDAELFSDIETREIIWGDIHQASLLGLRALSCQYDQGRAAHSGNRAFINSAKFWSHPDDIRPLESFAARMAWHVNVEYPSEFDWFFRAAMGEQLLRHFWFRITPRLGIAGSSVFCPWENRASRQAPRETDPLATVSVIPDETSTLIVITMTNSKDIRVEEWCDTFLERLTHGLDDLATILFPRKFVMSETYWESLNPEWKDALSAAVASHDPDVDAAARLVMPKLLGLDDLCTEWDTFIT